MCLLSYLVMCDGYHFLFPFDLLFQQFPYPSYKTDIFLQTIGNFLPLLLVMAFLFSAGVLVKVKETECLSILSALVTKLIIAGAGS